MITTVNYRVVVVGELNPYGSRPEFALYHLPRKASGNRLREHLGLTDVTYRRLDKVNLCDGEWDSCSARARAVTILIEGRHDVVVMLGAKVRRAFGEVGLAFFESSTPDHLRGRVLVTLPHPSGMCRAWNAPDARDKAVRLLKAVAPQVPWNETKKGLRPEGLRPEGLRPEGLRPEVLT
jgi:hypothetical protein